MSEKKKQTCQEEYPIGTEVIVINDCRRIKRATNKKGIIVKYLCYTLPKDFFPLEFKRKGEKYRVEIQDWDEDLPLEIPIIKYSRFGRIKGDCCFWISLIEKTKGILKKEVGK